MDDSFSSPGSRLRTPARDIGWSAFVGLYGAHAASFCLFDGSLPLKFITDSRRQRDIPVTACAELIATSRRRYAAMERSEAMIGLAELEVLVDFLGVPLRRFSHLTEKEASTDEIFVPFTPGEPVKIVFDARK